jgi:chromosome segregation ATPase
LAERYTAENKEKSACRAQLVQARAELAELQEQREAKLLQDRLASEGATITELIEAKAKLNKSQLEAEHVQRQLKDMENEVSRLTSELTRHQTSFGTERDKWQAKHRSDSEKLLGQEALLGSTRASLVVAEQKINSATSRAISSEEKLAITERLLRDAESSRSTLTIEVARLQGEVKRLELVASGNDGVQDLLKSSRADILAAQKLADERYAELQNKETTIRHLEDSRRQLQGEVTTLLDINKKAKEDHITQLATERARSIAVPSSSPVAAAAAFAPAPVTVKVVDTVAVDAARRDADNAQAEVRRLTSLLTTTQEQLEMARRQLRTSLDATNTKTEEADQLKLDLQRERAEIISLKAEIQRLQDNVTREMARATQAEQQSAKDVAVAQEATQAAQNIAAAATAQAEKASIAAAQATAIASTSASHAAEDDHNAIIAAAAQARVGVLSKELADTKHESTSAKEHIARLEEKMKKETARADAAEQQLIVIRQQVTAASVSHAPVVHASPLPAGVHARTYSTPPVSGPSSPIHVRGTSSIGGSIGGEYGSPLFVSSPGGEMKRTSELIKFGVTAHNLPKASSLHAAAAVTAKNDKGRFVDFVGRTEIIDLSDNLSWQTSITIRPGSIDEFKLSIYDGEVKEDSMLYPSFSLSSLSYLSSPLLLIALS